MPVHGREFPLEREDELGCEHRADFDSWFAMESQQVHLMAKTRVTHLDTQQEAVELRLGESVDAFLFDGVLSCKYEEWKSQRQRVAIDCYLVFLHRFE